jgi:hypothetical protein
MAGIGDYVHYSKENYNKYGIGYNEIGGADALTAFRN